MDPELGGALDALRQHIDQRLDEFGGRFDQVDRELIDLRRHVDTTAVDTRRHFDVVAEGPRGDKGLTRIDRVETTLRDEIVRSHDALAALIRLAYTDLDRRVTALERRPADSG